MGNILRTGLRIVIHEMILPLRESTRAKPWKLHFHSIVEDSSWSCHPRNKDAVTSSYGNGMYDGSG